MNKDASHDRPSEPACIAITVASVIAYSLVNAIWVYIIYYGERDRFFVFETPGLVGLALPLCALGLLLWIQLAVPRFRLPAISNVVLVATVGCWFFIVWSIVASASAAV